MCSHFFFGALFFFFFPPLFPPKPDLLSPLGDPRTQSFLGASSISFSQERRLLFSSPSFQSLGTGLCPSVTNHYVAAVPRLARPLPPPQIRLSTSSLSSPLPRFVGQTCVFFFLAPGFPISKTSPWFLSYSLMEGLISFFPFRGAEFSFRRFSLLPKKPPPFSFAITTAGLFLRLVMRSPSRKISN